MRVSSIKVVAAALWLAGATLASAPLAAGPFISEFCAVNDSVLPDEDLNHPDWCEIYNPDAAPFDLTGWALTDDPKKPAKWLFPAVTLGSKQFLVVFVSGKNRFDPAKPLHTSFQLNDVGYLALVSPDGKAVPGPGGQYPLQASDISYGASMDLTPTSLLGAGARVRAFVPADNTLALTWTDPAFDDTAWLDLSGSIGFDAKAKPTLAAAIQADLTTALKGKASSIYLRLPFTVPEGKKFDSLLLRVQYDDGFVAFLNGKEILRRNVSTTPAVLSNVSKALKARADDQALAFEEIDLTGKLDGLVPGPNLLAIQGLNVSKADLDYLFNTELEGAELTAVHPETPRYFSFPTPGSPNRGGAVGIAEAPVFSQEPGSYSSSFNLTLLSTAPDATIRYTLDRSEPKESSTLYTGPFEIATPTVVRARAYVPGLIPSPPVSSTYLILDPALDSFSSNLPLVVVTSFGRAITTLDTPVSISIIDTTADGQATLADTPDYIGNAVMHIRGSSSQQFPKKQYRLTLVDDQSRETDARLLGLSKDSDWILYAPYTDKSLMRDVLAYRWSNLIGTWAPHTRFCEVYVSSGNGDVVTEADYQGVYVLIEKIKQSGQRVDIAEMYHSFTTEPEITGGYILKKDRPGPGDIGFTTPHGQTLYYVDPKEEDLRIAIPQRNYIAKYFKDMETALYGANFKDPVKGYRAFLDVPAFIDHHIMVEATKNIDGFRLSTFMHKDRGGKLAMGPIWDYNLTMGNADYLEGWKPDGWYYTQIQGTADYPWYQQIFKDAAFVQEYRARWIEIRKNYFQVDTLLGHVDEFVELLKDAEARDHKKWPILGIYVWPNWYIAKTYQDEINFLKGWIAGRIEWMDSQFASPPAFSSPGGQVQEGLVLTITPPATGGGTVYYTIDTTDPRLPNGDLSPSAIAYQGPITINANTKVRARTLVDSIWSARKEAGYLINVPTIALTEIMYRPQPPPAGSQWRADDFEFVEVKNFGAEPVSLKGFRFTAGIVYDFTSGAVDTLGPGEYAVVVRNLAAFQSRYGTDGIKVAGVYTGDFSDRGEAITFVGSVDESLAKFSFLSTWYPTTADGSGHSLNILDPTMPRTGWPIKDSWKPSTDVGGSPGKGDGEAPPSGAQRAGDLNQDGKLSLSDAIQLLRHLFAGVAMTLPCDGGNGDGPGNTALLDLDGDRAVKLNDAVYLLVYLFQRGPAPALGQGCARIAGCPEVCR